MASLCLTACDVSKDYTMSFEDALDVSNRSELQDIIAQNDNFEQTFTIAGNYDADWTKVDANISSTSKQNLIDKDSESSTSFWANIASEWETIKVDGSFDLKLVKDVIYLNLSSINLTWSDDLAMVAMMAEWFKNQWFSLPIDWLGDIPNTFSIFKDSESLNEQAKEIFVNEWSTVYDWKFTQFNGYNAWKFSLDNEKLNALIKEYYDSLNTSTDEELSQEMPELNIQNFEWYLVITWKDKITTVIDNMDIVEWEDTLTVNGFWGESYEVNVLSDWESAITFVANKKRSNYEVSLELTDLLKVEWTVTTKMSKSNIDVKFDVMITVYAADEESDDTIIPLKGRRTYSPISEFSVEAPDNAQDLSEMLQGYLWGMLWWVDYSDYEDEDYDNMYDYENMYDFESDEAVVEEAAEEVEA